MKVLKASENKYLTQTKDVDIQDRIVGTIVYLASTDSEENWKEISEEEGNQLLIQKQEYFEKLWQEQNN